MRRVYLTFDARLKPDQVWTSLDKSAISSRLANEASIFTATLRCNIEQWQTGLDRPGCRTVTPAESRPQYADIVGSYFHALDVACSIRVSIRNCCPRGLTQILDRQLEAIQWATVNCTFMADIIFYYIILHIYFIHKKRQLSKSNKK